jgi:hypothetical protein
MAIENISMRVDEINYQGMKNGMYPSYIIS